MSKTRIFFRMKGENDFEDWDKDFRFYRYEEARGLTDEQRRNIMMDENRLSFDELCERICLDESAKQSILQISDEFAGLFGGWLAIRDGYVWYLLDAKQEIPICPASKPMVDVLFPTNPELAWVQNAVERMKEDPSYSITKEFARRNGFETQEANA